MKIKFITLALLLPFAVIANASSLIECQSNGFQAPLVITIETTGERLNEATKVSLKAQGMMQTFFDFNVNSSNLKDGVLALELVTDLPQDQNVEATLLLDTYTSYLTQRIYPIGLGEIQVHKRPIFNRYILEHYDLSQCVGII